MTALAERTRLRPGRVRRLAGRPLARSLRALPRGRTLPPDAWRTRHRWLLRLLWVHAAAIPLFALARGYGVLHSLVEGAPLVLFAALAIAFSARRRLSAALVAFGLISSSALLVHTSGGVIEAHFHFFVMMAVLTLYEDWMPYLIAAGYVVVHHGLSGVIDPADVYNHRDARDHPWKWAGIHGGAILAAGIANVVHWRLNENARSTSRIALERVRQSEAQLRDAQQVARIGSWDWEVRSGRLMWSPELYRLFAVDPDEFAPSYEGYFAMIHPDDRARADAAVQRALIDREPWMYEARAVTADGREWIVQARGRVVTEGDEVVRMVGTAQDVTDLRAAERTKEEFLSIVSHELRTPLTSVRGSLGLVSNGVAGPLPERAKRMTDLALQNAERLSRLIDDILDVQRMEAGRMTVEPRVVPVRELTTQAAEAMAGMAGAKDVSIAVAPSGGDVVADPDRIVQTLTNLLSNAIKFSPEGGAVSLAAECRDEEVEFRVADQGCGIPDDQLDSVFDRFQQVDASDSREKGGTGLGLSICRGIVEQHGGRIWAENAPEGGAVLVFTLPRGERRSGGSGPRAYDAVV